MRFVERAGEAGLDFRHVKSGVESKYLIETMGGGVALLDYDRDGRMDIFLVNGAQLADRQSDDFQPDKADPAYWNRLYRNLGGGRFGDVTREAGIHGRGYGMGAAAGDYDNDGDPDLLVTTYGGAYLYRNDGGRFRDVTIEARLKADGWTTGAGFFDYDRDGRLDLFIVRYLDWNFSSGARYCGRREPGGRSYCHPNEFDAVSGYLFHNEGGGIFRDVSGPSGIGGHDGKSLGLAFEDFDGDGWTDVFVANDSHPQFLFRNQRDGTFSEDALLAGVAYAEDGKTFAGMGVDFADVDGNARPDLLVTALPHENYAFFANRGDGAFDYATYRTGLAEITGRLGGWGARVFDFDNDGDADVFLANSHVMDNIDVIEPGLAYKQRPRLLSFRDGRFIDVSDDCGDVFRQQWAARGAAFGDLDEDGDIDAVVSVLDGPARVLFNDGGNRNRWIGFSLRGVKSNRDGFGAVVTVATKTGRRQRRMANPAGSYLSSHDPRLFFGLGLDGELAEVTIAWPSGIIQRLESLKPGRVHEIVEPPE